MVLDYLSSLRCTAIPKVRLKKITFPLSAQLNSLTLSAQVTVTDFLLYPAFFFLLKVDV